MKVVEIVKATMDLVFNGEYTMVCTNEKIELELNLFYPRHARKKEILNCVIEEFNRKLDAIDSYTIEWKTPYCAVVQSKGDLSQEAPTTPQAFLRSSLAKIAEDLHFAAERHHREIEELRRQNAEMMFYLKKSMLNE